MVEETLDLAPVMGRGLSKGRKSLYAESSGYIWMAPDRCCGGYCQGHECPLESSLRSGDLLLPILLGASSDVYQDF
ncbi:MAG: hypothetical protein MUQ10_18505 [Anaerolineae bacterium]|nr:hypothetical protein [Anaerolineae bacterium]